MAPVFSSALRFSQARYQPSYIAKTQLRFARLQEADDVFGAFNNIPRPEEEPLSKASMIGRRIGYGIVNTFKWLFSPFMKGGSRMESSCQAESSAFSCVG